LQVRRRRSTRNGGVVSGGGLWNGSRNLLSEATHEAFAIGIGRRGILNPKLNKMVELSIRRSGDGFVVGAPNVVSK